MKKYVILIVFYVLNLLKHINVQKKILTVVLFFIVHILSAQHGFTASGGDASGVGGSFSYSVGQVFYTTTINQSGTVSQGNQQSIELFVLSNPELTTLTLKAVTYPNPASDYVVLSLSDSTSLRNLSYGLYDLHRRLVIQNKLYNSNTKIDLSRFGSGSYVLQVFQDNKKLKSFKIIKK